MESSSPVSSGHAVARHLLDTYFKTNTYPFTRHHIDSYDQFISKDLGTIIKSENPLIILKDRIDGTDQYVYKVEVYIGGQDGSALKFGVPTVSLQQGQETRLLFPNEARLRNLTYAATVYADIYVKLTYTQMERNTPVSTVLDPVLFPQFPLFRIPIMLHSRYCVLHNKPKEFLEQAGECPQDHGGYFIIDGGERVIVTRQEQAFNTLYITKQENDDKISLYANINCFSPETRKRSFVSFGMLKKNNAIVVNLPYVRKAIPLFVIFRAMGIQSDEDICRTIFPDFESDEAKTLLPLLEPSVSHAFPFMSKYAALNFIKVFVKNPSIARVLDILYNQAFSHIENQPGARVQYLGQCVRRLLRVSTGLELPTDKDDTRNQRCLVSGFSTQLLFQDIYRQWLKMVKRFVDYEYNANTALYKGINFRNIFSPGNSNQIFQYNFITEGLMRAFKGKWGSGLGEDKAGLIQVLSRLSYLDFMSHCRRVVLDFDTSLKLTGPRHLHGSQYGYFCTHETPGGGSIGITKNLSILTTVSTGTKMKPIMDWLDRRGFLLKPNDLTPVLRAVYVPLEINNGLYGYSTSPILLVQVLKLLKHTGWLPASVSVGFNYSERRIFIYTDEGRPLRPLVIVRDKTPTPMDVLRSIRTWRDAVIGTDPQRQVGISNSDFADPLAEQEQVPLEAYIDRLKPYTGYIEYVDPYEQNLAYIASFHESVQPETTHIEVHPSTMLGGVNSLIPFLNHNQAPRNQLGCSQSKQAVSLFASNFKDRYDNQVHVLCYPQAPLVRSIYANYMGEGRMNNGVNIIMALATFQGYNQEDNIVINADAVARGLYRSIAYRTYEGFEEDDMMTGAKIRFGNPRDIGAWNDIDPNLDYSKIDERGFVRVGEYVDERTVIMGRYTAIGTKYKDNSITPQVWTRGRVEEVVVTVSPTGLRLVKVRVVQDRSPELGDKFTNRHGQKGTIGMLVRGSDMPRLANGVIPDVIVNPHSIPSRMTIAQLLEQLFGKAALNASMYADGTAFMNEGSPAERIGDILEQQFGAERAGNEILYNGLTGEQVEAQIFCCPLYYMRLKHMTEDKWNARGEGRREQRTHQPTGGRGQQGGLKIGEMDRDAIVCHGISEFFQESMMKRSDGTTHMICNGCGTFPIYNERLNIRICPLCDGPVKYLGDSAKNMEIIPALHQSRITFSKISAPYVLKLLEQELETYLNMGLRILTTKEVEHLRQPPIDPLSKEDVRGLLQQLVLPDAFVPELAPEAKTDELSEAELAAFGVPGAAQAESVNSTLETVEGPSAAPSLREAQANQELLVPLPEATLFKPSDSQIEAAQNIAGTALSTMKGEADALTKSANKQYYVVMTPSGTYGLIDENSVTPQNIMNVLYPLPALEERFPSMISNARKSSQEPLIQEASVAAAAQEGPQFMAQPNMSNQLFQPGAIPGAPPTLVVDTSQASPGFQQGGAMTYGRGRSRSPRRLAFRSQPMAIGMPQQGGAMAHQPLESQQVQMGGYDDMGGAEEQEGGGAKQYNQVVAVRKLG